MATTSSQNIITIDEVKHIAKLARLPLTNQEISKFQTQLSEILEYVNQLQKINTRGVEETSQVTGLINVFKKDKVRKCLPQKAVLSNTKQTQQGYFKVPSILSG